MPPPAEPDAYRPAPPYNYDRCGRRAHPTWLRFDGLGFICPPFGVTVPDHKRLHLHNFKLRQGFTVPQWVAMLNTRVFVLPLRAEYCITGGSWVVFSATA